MKEMICPPLKLDNKECTVHVIASLFHTIFSGPNILILATILYFPHIFVLPMIINEVMCPEALSGLVGLSSHPKVNLHSVDETAPT